MLLFGSFARGDFGARSDMDLLIVLKASGKPIRDRITDFLDYCKSYPTDVFPLTEAELQSRLEEGDPFWSQVMREGIELVPGFSFEKSCHATSGPLESPS